MNVKIKILIGILAVGTILITGLWTWKSTETQNYEPNKKYCEEDSDCALDFYGRNSCCMGCNPEVINTVDMLERGKWRKINCDKEKRGKCSKIECPPIKQEVKCINNICIAKSTHLTK